MTTSTDPIEVAEEAFYRRDLLGTDYLQNYRTGYYECQRNGALNPYRNYLKILSLFEEIRAYDRTHADSFAKRIKSQGTQWKDCEAIVSEMIAYNYYIRLIKEDLVKKLYLEQDECDVIVERPDGSRMYLEILCVMPEYDIGYPGEDKPCSELRSHTQSAKSSIRQKILHKSRKQNQFSKQRENYVVVELNDALIAGDFTILSSLSDGYKIMLNRETMKVDSEGFDWRDSVFDDPATRFLKGIIWFNLGNYCQRKIILNPRYQVQA
jgi:hypothetical protein